MFENKPRYEVDGQIEDEAVCSKARMFVECWTAAFNDPSVFEGEIEATEFFSVKIWARELEKEGYRMEYDIEEEGFWLVRIADGKAVDIFYY